MKPWCWSQLPRKQSGKTLFKAFLLPWLISINFAVTRFHLARADNNRRGQFFVSKFLHLCSLIWKTTSPISVVWFVVSPCGICTHRSVDVINSKIWSHQMLKFLPESFTFEGSIEDFTKKYQILIEATFHFWHWIELNENQTKSIGVFSYYKLILWTRFTAE